VSGSALRPFTRRIFVLGVSLTIGTGIGLYAVPGRTADYWAWTIKAPLSAAFFGAGYIGAAITLALGARARVWRDARIVAVLAFTLTSLALVETLRDLGPFAFGDGGLIELVAWVWLAVYVVLPPLLLAAFVLQEARTHDDRVERPALTGSRVALGAVGAVSAVIGILLLAPWDALSSRWPWPLPTLPATIVGAWLCTFAAGLLWFAIREREWSRARVGIVPMVVPVALDLAAAGRLHTGLQRGAATAVYLGSLAVVLAVLVSTIAVEELRLRRVDYADAAASSSTAGTSLQSSSSL
jgi:hypothetical protein